MIPDSGSSKIARQSKSSRSPEMSTGSLSGLRHREKTHVRTAVAIVRRHVQQVWNRQRLDVIPETIHRDYVGHPLDESPTDNKQRGPERYVRAVSALLSAFPDLHFRLLDVHDAGEIVVTRWQATGTQLGLLRIGGVTIMPTGRKVCWSGIDIWRVSDGQIIENWSVGDRLGLLRSLSVTFGPSRQGPA